MRDEGRGIAQEEISRIFTPFFSMRESGTGLGLFITNRIIKEHGGLLEVKSQLGKGSTFDILLPVGSDDDETDHLPEACAELLETLAIEAKKYLDGDRLQGSLFPNKK